MERKSINLICAANMERNMFNGIQRSALVWAFIALFLVACGPAVKTEVVKEQPVDTGPTPEEIAEQKRQEDAERRKAELAKSLQLRKVVVAETPEFVPGVEVDAQKSFKDGVVSVYMAPPDYSGASLSFEDSIAKDKNFLEAYFNLGMVYERKGEGEKALEVYQKALDANPGSGSAKAYIGKVYLAKAREAAEAGHFGKATELENKAKGLFDEVIVQEPNNVQVNNALALYWLMKAAAQDDKARRIDAVTTAEDFIQHVLTVQPANVIALNTRGLIYVLKGELQIARWIFENKVLKLDRYSTEAYNNLGLTYYKLGKIPKAVANFHRAIQVNPENLEARLNLAAILLNYLHYGAAKEQYSYVLASRPNHVEATVGMGSSLVGMQEFDEGFTMWKKAYELDTAKVDLLGRIGKLYQTKLVDFDSAIKAFEVYIAEAQKHNVDITEAQKSLEQSKKMAEQMRNMEIEMKKAEEEALRMEEKMKKVAVELEKKMKKLESKAHDYEKKLSAFIAETKANKKSSKKDRKRAKEAKKLLPELAKVDPAFKEAREYMGMQMVQESEFIFKAVEEHYNKQLPLIVEVLQIEKVQKVEEEGGTPAPKVEEKKAEPKAEEKKAEPKAEEKKAEPKAEEKKEEPKAEEKKEEPKAEEKKEEPKAEEKKEEPKAEEKKEEPKAEEKKEEPKAEEKKEEPKAEEKKEEPKAEEKKEEPKAEEKKEEPKAEEKKEEPKAEEKKEEPKAEEKKEEPKAEEKKEEPKAEEKK